MGAPGIVMFCKKGHLFCLFDDDLYWGNFGVNEEGVIISIPSEFEELERRLREKGCPCGSPTFAVIPHDHGNFEDYVVLVTNEKIEKIGEVGLPLTYITARGVQIILGMEVYDITPLIGSIYEIT